MYELCPKVIGNTGVDPKIWALLGGRVAGCKFGFRVHQMIDIGITCHVQTLSNDLIVASYNIYIYIYIHIFNI